MLHGNHRFDPGTFLVYVDSYDNGVMGGRYYQPIGKESGTFQSMMQFLLAAEQYMDTDNTPQSFHAVRTFSPIRSLSRGSGEEVLLKLGEIATFSVHIMFRRSTTWQGSITWLEEKKTQNFRSVLELMILIDSAIAKKEMLLHSSRSNNIPLQKAE